ncbi:MAG: response regulator [Ignavibacteriales bacterium]|nr:MAG: response regulator [Ignavibacteriales bacterium]
MKLSYRIIFINFAIVVLVIASSAVGFYSIMYNALTSQQSRHLLNAANNFIYTYREFLEDVQGEYYLIKKDLISDYTFTEDRLGKNLDFVLQVHNDESNLLYDRVHKDFIIIPSGKFSIEDFILNNPYAIVQIDTLEKGNTFYYGKLFSSEIIHLFARRINVELALVWNGIPSEISNPAVNQRYFYALNEASIALQNKKNYDLFASETESTDILATIYKPSYEFVNENNFKFLLFSTLNEAADLRSNLKDILIIIGLASVTISLILTYIFTSRIRKQVGLLSKATEITSEGHFKSKITLKSNDEIGQLADAFNTMIDEIEKNQKAKKEYAEFIALINQNPTLKEIGEATLSKIIKICGFTVGALYLVESESVSLISSFGLNENISLGEKSEFYQSVIKKKETLEIISGGNLPVISTGLVAIEIKYLLLVPVLYNNRVIALLELASIDKPTPEAREYLVKIQDQLAVGLMNATTLRQLEDLVKELKQLNEDYQKQNLQVKKQNDALLELHTQLKEKADELEIQKERAEESTRVKSQFLASMSHELRTPMNSILGLTELILQKGILRDNDKERLEVVFKNGKRLMNLINDILDLSKIEAGKMELHFEDVVLDDMINDIEVYIKPLLLNKSIEFKTVKEINTSILIKTDRSKVTQVMVNLLSNAIKFTERGFVEFKISTDEKQQLEFMVSDSGIGISEEDQKIIFEEFRQIDGTTTRKYSGTGLGLNISRKIAALLSGSISVKSQPSIGSSFIFSIPFTLIKELPRVEVAKVNPAVLKQNRLNPVLVIDDDAEVRYTIGQYLSTRGYEVIYAEDGQRGIEKAVRFQPFAITLDIMLPGKDGWNILKALKENSQTKDIPVIMVSILADQNLGYGLGAFDYFVKPVSANQLLSAFDKLEGMTDRRIEKIVLVDDEEFEFDLIKNAFKDQNIRIHYIKDSEIAFSKIREIQPDLAIIDLFMPKIDGINLSQKLKSHKETKHIPIIINTERDLTEDEEIKLQAIVEDITIKTRSHPLDVLKIVRDRINQQEEYYHHIGIDIDSNSNEVVKSPDTEINEEYLGDVFIIDDDPDTLFTLNEIVQECGCKTILGKSGKDCLSLLQQKIPDLILLDIMMPEMDGFQTITKIRENPEWKDIPVFAVTAKAMAGDKEIILKHGFDDYINKPVDANAMAFKIERTIKQKNS